ncbi:MAG: hypothetical protein ACOY3V_04490, partial [Pseudomonadota bacterium]
MINAGIVDNSGGYLSIGNGFSLYADMLQNSGGRIEIADGEANILLAGNFDNSAGVFLRGGSGELKIGADTLHNDGGYIGMQEGAANISLAGAFDNNTGTFLHEGAGEVTVNADWLDNRQGFFIAGEGLLLQQNADAALPVLDNRYGYLQTGRGFSVFGAGLNNAGGKIISGGFLAAHLGGYDFDNSGGSFSAGGHLVLDDFNRINNAGGIIQSARHLSLYGDTLDNSRFGKIIVRGGLVRMSLTGEFNNSGGLFSYDGGWSGNNWRLSDLFTLDAGSLNNSGGRIEIVNGSARLNIDGRLDNSTGVFVHQGSALVVAAETLNNFQGALASSGAFTLNLHGTDTLNPSLDNREGLLQGNAGLTISGIGLTNADGDLQSDGAINLDLGNGALNNSSNGRILALGDLTINAAFGVNNSAFGVTNISGGIFSGGTINLNLGSGALDNSSGGRIQAYDAISIDSGSL